jgi:hypothetical protein
MDGCLILPSASEASETTPDDPMQRAAVEAELCHGYSVAQKDRDDVREALAESRVGVYVEEGVGETMGRKDFVEQDGHLVTEMTAGAGHELVAGLEDGSAEEHGGKIARPLPESRRREVKSRCPEVKSRRRELESRRLAMSRDAETSSRDAERLSRDAERPSRDAEGSTRDAERPSRDDLR